MRSSCLQRSMLHSAFTKRQLFYQVVLLVVVIFLFGAQVGAQDGSGDTSSYVFLTDQSTVVQTGGVAGVYETYPIQGQFQLTVDANAGVASFAAVDANLLDPNGFLPTQSLSELFNMTELQGTVVNDELIEFRGKTADDTNTDIALSLTFTDDAIQLTGQTIPPPDSADFFIFNVDAFAQKKYSGGTGEPNDPYQVATAADLIFLGETPDDYNKHFIITADIDLNPNLPGGRVFSRAVIAPDTDDELDRIRPFFHGISFEGSLNGDGHQIRNLTIEGKVYLGLFGFIGSNGTISNLCLVNAKVNGSHYRTGGIAGGNGGSIIASCSIGNISGDGYVGGLTGFNSGVIATCYSDGEVRGESRVGGLVGSNPGSISRCYSECLVSGSSHVGGFAGERYNYGTINNCYSAGKVTGGEQVGGFLGYNHDHYQFKFTDGKNFWDTQRSGQDSSSIGIGRTTVQMQDSSTFRGRDWGWDFNEIWEMRDGCDYPRLQWESRPMPRSCQFARGTGEPNDPYQIATAEDLMLLGETWEYYDKHFILIDNIDLSEYIFKAALIARHDYSINSGPDGRGGPGEPVDVPEFMGSFDGNGYLIQNLHIEDGGSSLGLFGHLAAGSSVVNLGLEDVTITSKGNYIGGLVGQSNGYVSNCYTTGSISGNASVGGLVGTVLIHGQISSCYSMAEVAGEEHIGGLVGSNEGRISYSYSTGLVKGNDSTGGLVGSGRYFASDNVFFCFWDKETSGRHKNVDGTELMMGLTTVEMQRTSTFLAAGWDFVEETENGTDNIWRASKGIDYPYLYWQPLEKYSGGLSTRARPYKISTAQDLVDLGNEPNDYDKHFVLTANIDMDPNLTGIRIFNRAVIAPDEDPTFNQNTGNPHDGTPFTGMLDGKGYTISNLVIDGNDYIGLFGEIGSEAMISNIVLEAVDIKGLSDVGGLAGRNKGSISNCGISGQVTGRDAFGGLIGTNKDGYISSCYSKAEVVGTPDWGNNAGGLVGNNYGDIKDCYSQGDVDGRYTIGGLVGMNMLTISKCYSSGDVTGIRDETGGLIGKNHLSGFGDEHCFYRWSTQVSWPGSGSSAHGLSENEMKNIEYFLGHGWDFINETDNGTDNIWLMPEDNYPQLAWEFRLPTPPSHIADSFETGGFFTLFWENENPDVPWQVTNAEANTGTYSAQSGEVGDSESSTLSLTCECTYGQISFALKVSSEEGYDELIFSIDGVAAEAWSGEQDWIDVNYSVSSGSHTFSWSYEKDELKSLGQDAAWIDKVELTDQIIHRPRAIKGQL